MSDKITKTPQIRFDGFMDDWEQRKLGEVFKKDNQKNTDLEFHSDSIISVAQMKSVLNIKDSSDRYMTTYNKIRLGNIVFEGHSNKEFPNGRFVLNDYKDGIVSHIYDVYSAISIYDDEFMKRYINNQTVMRKILINSTSNARMMNSLNSEEFLKQELTLPNFQEQSMIGSFFKQLDETIALHQRKYDLLKETKQSYLQKMFPKSGEDQPEIRFAGFTEPWEQRKLGEVAERIRGNDGRMDLPTLTISAGSGWLDQRERFSGNIAGKEQKNYTLLHKGELSYNHGNSKLAKYGAVFELRTYEEALVPRVYHSFKMKKGAVPDFIEYLFATKRPDRELRKLISSGARMDRLLNINFDEFMGIKISLPTVAEQEVISEFLRSLDNTITLHQNQLNILKSMKQSLLQQMFV